METKSLITCQNSIMAENIQQLLEENGIKSMIIDQTTNKAIAFGANTPGYEILVDEDEYDAAKEIADAVEEERNEMMPWCPKCGSENVTKSTITYKHGKTWHQISVMVFIILGVAVALFTRGEVFVLPGILVIVLIYIVIKGYSKDIYHCKDCGNDFKKDMV